MNGLIHSSLYFGMLVSVGAYMLGVWLKKKTGWAILNPLLVAIIVVIAFLSVFCGQCDRGAEAFACGLCFL